MISLILGETSEEHRLRIHHKVFHIESNVIFRSRSREKPLEMVELGFRRPFETGVDVH